MVTFKLIDHGHCCTQIPSILRWWWWVLLGFLCGTKLTYHTISRLWTTIAFLDYVLCILKMLIILMYMTMQYDQITMLEESLSCQLVWHDVLWDRRLNSSADIEETANWGFQFLNNTRLPPLQSHDVWPGHQCHKWHHQRRVNNVTTL